MHSTLQRLQFMHLDACLTFLLSHCRILHNLSPLEEGTNWGAGHKDMVIC